jgi:dimethylamine corrinoid protein
MAENNDLFRQLSDAVLNMDEDETERLAKEVVEQGLDAFQAIDLGLSDGMNRAGDLFEQGEYFVPELIICSDAMYKGLDILKPHIKAEAQKEKHRIVIGVIEGDTHDIGKNLVKIMLDTAGFELIDLGRDIPPEGFVQAALENNAAVIAISTLMTTTMDGLGKVIELLKSHGIRDKFKVIVGGGPISQKYADSIGADGYSVNAAGAVRLVNRLLAAEK